MPRICRSYSRFSRSRWRQLATRGHGGASRRAGAGRADVRRSRAAGRPRRIRRAAGRCRRRIVLRLRVHGANAAGGARFRVWLRRRGAAMAFRDARPFAAAAHRLQLLQRLLVARRHEADRRQERRLARPGRHARAPAVAHAADGRRPDLRRPALGRGAGTARVQRAAARAADGDECRAGAVGRHRALLRRYLPRSIVARLRLERRWRRSPA